ncbi:Uncharacterized protein APZ42_028892 [Daphnia magna]|uniref:Uncharacterized protein n=1 Tax=Daphnia magna TaxID=35525 RepID=A0A164Q1Q1_9CRUS|nr:Uncharacterized protein APZ42_028892 [Daphnia magna]
MLQDIPVTNWCPKSVWLKKGVTLGTLGEFQETENTEKSGEASGTNGAIEKMDQKFEKLLDNLKSRMGKYLHGDQRLSEDDLGHWKLVSHDIYTGVNPPIYQLPFKKKDGTWRFCVDYLKLNAVTVKDSYPLPRDPDTLSRLERAKIFSSMDLQSEYQRVSITSKDRPKTAFVTAEGVYQFRTLLFGLSNVPDTFQQVMYIILAEHRWTTFLVYVVHRLLGNVRTTFRTTPISAGLPCKSKPEHFDYFKLNSSFAEDTLKVIGRVFTKEGVGTDPEKLDAMKNFPSPAVGHSKANKIQRVQSYLGLCSYYRRHIQNFATIIRNSFNALKVALTSTPVLAHSDYDLQMKILPDACGFGIGGVLAQRIDGVERPVAYASRLLSKSETNYSITETECLALLWWLTKFRCFGWGCQVKVIADHQALCWGKTHGNGNCLSRNPLQQIEEMEDDRCFIVAAIGPNASDIFSPKKDVSVVIVSLSANRE